MILIDLSQISMSGIHVNLGNDANRNNPNAKSLIKHMIINTILSYKKKYGEVYGEVLLAIDNRHYWRREQFPYYKGNRKKAREKSDYDWEFIFEILNEIKSDLKENFPYKMIDVAGAEADDVIACIVKYLQENELKQDGLFESPQDIMIVSGDGDFVQLQKYPTVKQYSPIVKKLIKPSGSVKEYKMTHICIAGDDGIPNICSADNSFVDNIRQKSFRKARLPEFFAKGIDACADDTERRNFQRNQLMIDFDFIPEKIYNDIIAEYKNSEVRGNKTKIMNYLIKNRMKLLLESVGDF